MLGQTLRRVGGSLLLRVRGSAARPPGASRCCARKLAARSFPPPPPAYELPPPYGDADSASASWRTIVSNGSPSRVTRPAIMMSHCRGDAQRNWRLAEARPARPALLD